ncbi:MAG: LCP family protein [Nitriliruptoraceae bacterium]
MPTVDGAPGPWGPTVEAGRSARLLRRLAVLLGVGGLLVATATATTAQLLVRQAEANLTRVPVPGLASDDDTDDEVEPIDARTFLLVGSDDRDGLDPEVREDLPLGEFDGQRSDVVMLLSISADRDQASLVSFPRDLLVDDAGTPRKLTDTFMGGPEQLIGALRTSFQVPVNHYAEITLGGFLDVVETVGEVEICLEEPLRDRRSGADFDAGCHDMDAVEALSFVRSRQGERGDLERIDRQQELVRAVVQELTAARTLANPRQLARATEDVASAMVIDDQLGTRQLLGLADELRSLVGAGFPMTSVPAYPQTIDGLDYMVAYGPGADALFRDLRSGRPLAERGTPQDREETVVTIVTAGSPGAAGIVESTTRWAGFETRVGGVAGVGEGRGVTTAVLVVPGEEERAEWVAATLGAPTEPLPEGVEVPEGVHVVVVAGTDALP